MDIEKRIENFLRDRYKNSLYPSPEKFRDELLDIKEEAEMLGSFDIWLERFKEQQKILDSM